MKLYIHEPESAAVNAWRRQTRGALPLTAHARLEILNGICLAAFRADIDADARTDALASLDEDVTEGRYAEADVDARKQLFAQHLLNHVPLASHIRRVLDDRATHTAPARRFRDELEDFMSPEYAAQTLKAVTQWGRYGELYAFDEAADLFSLDNPA